MRRDDVVELVDGRRVSVPVELLWLVDLDTFHAAGMWFPSPCGDCGEDTTPRNGGHEFYMVHEHVWALAGAPKDVYLCIGCLERRLRRTLTPADFNDAPVNSPDWEQDSARLLARKTATPQLAFALDAQAANRDHCEGRNP